MNRYRLVYVGLVLALIALVVSTWVLSEPGGDRPLPAQLRSVSPAPNATALRQATVVVEMEPGYSLDMSINGEPVPVEELQVSAALGRFEWAPGPGRRIEQWQPGRYVVSISWNALAGLPDVGSFSWEFNIQ